MQVPTTEFSVGSLAGCQDPYALYAELLEQGPVLRNGETWLVLGRAEAEAVLRSPQARSGFAADLYRQVLPPSAAREELGNRINFLDPPDHSRVRRLVAKVFSPKRVEALRPYLHRLCRDKLRALESNDVVDLITGFAHQIPSFVISELLGVPVRERDRLTDLADRVADLLGSGVFDPAKVERALPAAEEMHATLRGLIDVRRSVPRDDLLSALIAVEEDRQHLTESELLSLAATLYSAGHRTTRDLFSNGLARLLADAPTVAAFRRGEIDSPAIVEEFLRFETPTHYVARMGAEPIDAVDTTIPPRETIVVMLAAANRDPRAYDDPHRFEPRRWKGQPEPPPPLSFALGAHFCLGASLARMEAGVMLETLFETFPQLRLTDQPLRWRHTGLFRGLETLPVVTGPAL